MKTLSQTRYAGVFSLIKSFACICVLSACSDSSLVEPAYPGKGISASDASAKLAWGSESPNFNLEAILRGEEGAFGLVKFRQPNDDKLIVNLDTWVRGLEPNTQYLLQRAVDTNLDGNCTSTTWLTLGLGLQAQAIVTDDSGFGTVHLFRSVAAFPVGTTFDIHFQVINASSSMVVLSSDCYQFTISQ